MLAGPALQLVWKQEHIYGSCCKCAAPGCQQLRISGLTLGVTYNRPISSLKPEPWCHCRQKQRMTRQWADVKKEKLGRERANENMWMRGRGLRKSLSSQHSKCYITHFLPVKIQRVFCAGSYTWNMKMCVCKHEAGVCLCWSVRCAAVWVQVVHCWKRHSGFQVTGKIRRPTFIFFCFLSAQREWVFFVYVKLIGFICFRFY